MNEIPIMDIKTGSSKFVIVAPAAGDDFKSGFIAKTRSRIKCLFSSK